MRQYPIRIAVFTLSLLAVLMMGNPSAISSKGSVGKSQVRLVMVEEHGCPYCRAWIRDVGNYYHKTSEGKFAPLVRVDRKAARKRFSLVINFTPTFVVLKDGKEVGRLIGYIDDSFFWPKLDEILSRHGYKADEEPS